MLAFRSFSYVSHLTPEGRESALRPLNDLAAGHVFSAEEGVTGQFEANLDQLGEETG